MRNTIECEHCGTPIEFGEEDRGFTEYCSSCGRAVQIPAAPNPEVPSVEPTSPSEPLPASSDLASVFSASGRAAIGQRVVAEEDCLCGSKVPVRVEDYGATVYCPSCGTEIRVGRSLQGAKFPVARQLDEKDVAGNGSAVVRRPVGKRIGLRRSLVAALVAVLASVAIAWLTGSFRGNTDRSSNGRTIVTRRSTLQETPTESPGNVAASTHSDSEQPKVVSRITQAMIAQLRKTDDPAAALVQAQLWQETLRDQQASQKDPRWILLLEVIEDLTEQLFPSPKGPPASVVAFRKSMRLFVESLVAEKLDIARRAHDEMAQLLRDHPDELTGFSQSLSSVRRQLEKEESFATAVDRIRQEIRAAEEFLNDGHLNEALKAEAKARFLVRTTPVTVAEEVELHRLYQDLSRQTRLARGKRAVRDAERCDEAGDLQARNREVRRALALLPGLPEGQVKPWLQRLDKWLDPSGNLPPSADRDRPSSASSIAREIRIRDQYELILDHYARGDCNQLLAAGLELQRKLAPDETLSATIHGQLGDLLFDVAQRKLELWAQSPNPEPENGDLVRNAGDVRSFLDRLDPWKTDPRWKSLDEAIRSMTDESE